MTGVLRFKFDPSDWLRETRGMSPFDIGIYVTLIAMMYERQAPVRHDVGYIARTCGATNASTKACLDRLFESGKITLTEDGLVKRGFYKKTKDRCFHSGKSASDGSRPKNCEKAILRGSEGKKAEQNQCPDRLAGARTYARTYAGAHAGAQLSLLLHRYIPFTNVETLSTTGGVESLSEVEILSDRSSVESLSKVENLSETFSVETLPNVEILSGTFSVEPLPNVEVLSGPVFPIAIAIGRAAKNSTKNPAKRKRSEILTPEQALAKRVFDGGITVLTKSGRSNSQARSIIGKWRKATGDADLERIIAECDPEVIADPVEWITKAISRAKRDETLAIENRRSGC